MQDSKKHESLRSDHDRYEGMDYLQATGGTWHLEDASFKATQVLRMLTQHELAPHSVCEVGCGAGGVLKELRARMPSDTRFTGCDISTVAVAMANRQWGHLDRIRFLHGDMNVVADSTYDLVLALDVLEHVEDCFGFLLLPQIGNMEDVPRTARNQLFGCGERACALTLVEDGRTSASLFVVDCPGGSTACRLRRRGLMPHARSA